MIERRSPDAADQEAVHRIMGAFNDLIGAMIPLEARDVFAHHPGADRRTLQGLVAARIVSALVSSVSTGMANLAMCYEAEYSDEERFAFGEALQKLCRLEQERILSKVEGTHPHN